MFEGAYVSLAGENLLVFGGLAFVCLSVACEVGFRLGARRPRRSANRDGVGTITASSCSPLRLV
jgi:hypothetical protein